MQATHPTCAEFGFCMQCCLSTWLRSCKGRYKCGVMDMKLNANANLNIPDTNADTKRKRGKDKEMKTLHSCREFGELKEE